METELKRRDFRFSRGRLFVCAFVALPVVFDLAWLVRVAPTALTGARVPSGFATPIVLPAVARAMAVLPPLAILFALLALLAALEFRVRRRDRSIATRIRALAAEAGTATTTIRSQGA